MSETSTAPEQVTPATEPVGTNGIRVDLAEKKILTLPTGAAAFILTAAIALTLIGGATLAVAIKRAMDYDAATSGSWVLGAVAVVAAWPLFGSLNIVNPGETRVVTFFGRYLGTLRATGLSATIPFTRKYQVPVKVLNFETDVVKANEQGGSPVQVSAVVVWQVADTAKAIFAVENYSRFIKIQSESALRHVVSAHPYDTVEVAEGQEPAVTLRGNGQQVADELAAELAERVALAGLEVVEVRLSSLAYAPEIAGAMLQRQQAQAILGARRVIVEGAVTMAKDAIKAMEEDADYAVDPDKRAAMAANLVTVIVGGGHVQPITNVGTLHN